MITITAAMQNTIGWDMWYYGIKDAPPIPKKLNPFPTFKKMPKVCRDLTNAFIRDIELQPDTVSIAYVFELLDKLVPNWEELSPEFSHSLSCSANMIPRIVPIISPCLRRRGYPQPERNKEKF